MRSELRHNRDRDTKPAPDAGLEPLYQIHHNWTVLPALEISRVLLKAIAASGDWVSHMRYYGKVETFCGQRAAVWSVFALRAPSTEPKQR